jgi:hypothetical protein
MRIIYDNLFDDGTLDASTEADNYPVENIVNQHSSVKWRSTTGSLTSQWVTVDAGAGETFTVDCVAILGHNFTNSATIKFQMNATDSWGSPSVDETLTWREGMILKFFTESTYRFARISIDDAGNTDNYLTIGRIFMSTYLQISPSSKNNFKITNNTTDTTSFSISGESYSDIGCQYRTFDYSFPPTDFDMIDDLRTMFETVGNHQPFVFLNFDTRYTEIEPAYVVWTNKFQETHVGHNKIGYTLKLREVV